MGSAAYVSDFCFDWIVACEGRRHEKVFAMRKGSRFREVTGAGTARSTKSGLPFRSSNLLAN